MYKCILVDKKGFRKKIELQTLPSFYSISDIPEIPFIAVDAGIAAVAIKRIDFRLEKTHKGYYIFNEV